MKFPRIHVAESVVNRILNTADEIETNARKLPAVGAAPPPTPPDPTLEGASLDARLAAPTAPVEANQEVLAATAQGGTPLGGLIRETVK